MTKKHSEITQGNIHFTWAFSDTHTGLAGLVSWKAPTLDRLKSPTLSKSGVGRVGRENMQ